MDNVSIIKIAFAGIAAILGTVAFYPYIRDILKRKTTPHAYTWLIWTITQGTATIGMWRGGAGVGAIGLTVGGFLVFTTFLLSTKFGTKNITRTDTALLIIALCGVACWWLLDSPLLAILIASAIDGVGFLPTFRKVWSEPYSETLSSWGLFFVGNIFALLALESYNLLTVVYLVTALLGGTTVLLISLFRRNSHR